MPKPPTSATKTAPRTSSERRKHINTANRAPSSDEALQWLLGRLKPMPPEWATASDRAAKGLSNLKPLACGSFEELQGYWKQAMQWRQELSDVLSLMLAVAVSTNRTGSQACLLVVGAPGSGKSELADSLMVSKRWCRAVENPTGATSGFKGSRSFSLLDRGNNQCWVTSEADVLIQSPNYRKFMADFRRIFDGKFTSSYRNMDEDMEFDSLRITWIKLGTPAMLNSDIAGLGDRFLKIRLSTPSLADGKKIVQRVHQTAWDDVVNSAIKIDEQGNVVSAEDGAGTMNPLKQQAYCRTAGYLEMFMNNPEYLNNALSSVTATKESIEQLERWAYRIAYFRSRPDLNEEIEAVVEQPTRVVSQITRVTRCLAAIRQETNVEDNVLGIMKSVVDSSCYGYTHDIAMVIANKGPSTSKGIELGCRHSKTLVQKGIEWLHKIGVIELNTPAGSRRINNASWKLTKLGKWLTL